MAFESATNDTMRSEQIFCTTCAGLEKAMENISQVKMSSRRQCDHM